MDLIGDNGAIQNSIKNSKKANVETFRIFNHFYKRCDPHRLKNRASY